MVTKTANPAKASDMGGMKLNMIPSGIVRYRGGEYALGPATPAISAFDAMHRLQLDVMPVVDGGVVRGAVKMPAGYSPKNRDVAKYFSESCCRDVSMEDFGSAYPRAPYGFTVDDAMGLMREHGLSHLPIVGNDDAHAGMVGMYGPRGLLSLDGIFEQLEKKLNEPRIPYLCTRG
ncbi:MAG: CBS domain-containing protein [Candidatus Aenigmarchaeota archaeon]|nr:CBS domain-containing protein [Candidatus Aenigmarchaeota archaeon]